MRWLAGIIVVVVLAFWSATQTFALLAQYAPQLGPPLWYPVSRHALYSPVAIITWWGWWHSHIPRAFLLPALAGCVVLALGGAFLFLPRASGPSLAGWASLWALWQAGCGRHGLVLGKVGPWILRWRSKGHVLIVGGPDTGKTVSVLQPTLIEYAGSLFVYDPKGTLWGYEHDDGTRYDFAAYRRTLGAVVRYAPTREDSDFYNPLAALDMTNEAQLVRQAGLIAQLLLEPEGERRTSDAGQHYSGHAYALLKAELLLGVETGWACTGADVLAMHSQVAWKDLVTNMQGSAIDALKLAGGELSQWQDKRMVSGVRQTVSRALEMFTDPLVARMTSQSSLPMDALRNAASPCTVYFHVPFTDHARLRPLMRIIVTQHLLYNAVVRRWKRRLPMLFEELPSLGHLGILSDGLNFARESGVQLICVTPSMNEIKRYYGATHNFWEGCRTQLFFGLTDPAVAEDVSKRLGMQQATAYQERHVVRPQGVQKRRVRVQVERPLLSATGVQKLDPSKVILIAGQQARVLTQARFYQRRVWRKRSQVS